MKKIGDLMADLGFREDAPESVKKAFVDSLTRTLAKENAPALTCPAVVIAENAKLKKVVESTRQLSFFETEEPLNPKPSELKRSRKPRTG